MKFVKFYQFSNTPLQYINDDRSLKCREISLAKKEENHARKVTYNLRPLSKFQFLSDSLIFKTFKDTLEP